MYSSEVHLLSTFCVLAITISTESLKWKASFHVFSFMKCEVATRKTGLCYYKNPYCRKEGSKKVKKSHREEKIGFETGTLKEAQLNNKQ